MLIRKVWKKEEDGMKLNGCYRMKVNSKALDVPVLTAMISNFMKQNLGVRPICQHNFGNNGMLRIMME